MTEMRTDDGTLREGIADKVVELILGQIRSGKLSPGEKLPSERDLSRKLSVGRPSLREAMRALALLGVLDIRHGEGIFVSQLGPRELLEPLRFYLSLSEHSLDQLFEARIIVESGTAGIAARTLDKEGLAVLKRCIEEGESAIADPTRFLELDVLFHDTIVKAAGNPFLQEITEAFRSLTRASRSITVGVREIRVQSHEDHKEVFEALLYRDEEGASRAMSGHLRAVWRAYREALA